MRTAICTVYMKQHDTYPNLEIRCLDKFNDVLTPVDMSVMTSIRVFGRTIGHQGATEIYLFENDGVGTEDGIVTMEWQTGDTEVACKNAEIEIEAILPNGKIATFPNNGYIAFSILEDLG